MKFLGELVFLVVIFAGGYWLFDNVRIKDKHKEDKE